MSITGCSVPKLRVDNKWSNGKTLYIYSLYRYFDLRDSSIKEQETLPPLLEEFRPFNTTSLRQ